MPHQKTFLILDGNALLHRAWHSLPQTMTTADGTIINAAYGFTMVVERVLEKFKPDYMAVAWDLADKTFRHDEYVPYKATRVKKEQALYDQIPIIQDILKCYGIPSLSKKGFEADDILGTIAEFNKKKKINTSIVTGDQDALQLVDDTTSVIFFIKGVSETKTFDPAAVKEKYGFEPLQLIDYKALAGDSSDNIPGVVGIGEKSAKELISQFGSVEGILEAIKKTPEAIKASWRAKFDGNEKHALQMKRLVTIVRDVPLGDFKLEDAEVKKPDQEKLIEKFRSLEFRTLLKKYGVPAVEKTVTETPTLRHAPKSYELKHVELAELATDTLAIAVELQAEDLFGGTIKSMAISDSKNVFVTDHPTPDDIKKILVVASKAQELIGHDFKAIMHAIHERLDGNLFDTYIACYLLNPAGRSFELPIIAQNSLGISLSEHPSAEQTVSVLFDLWHKCVKELGQENLIKVLIDLDMPVVPILYEMETHGIKLDVEFLATLAKKMHHDLDALTKTIYKEAKREFNINSPSQLADILFEDLEIPTTGIKRTKTGYSTAVEELEKIEDLHPIVPSIMEYRELAKLISTYVDSLPNLVGKDGRLHTTFNQSGTATGRLSSNNPNLQNIPIRTEQGREIRKAFIAEKDHVILTADYSQFELRLAAVMAKDASFLRAFKEGADIHKRTAAEIFEIEESKVTVEQRRAAKTVNFAVLYGMGPRNLAKATGMSQAEAKMFIEKYFTIHHAIRDYIDALKIKVHSEGFVETLFGRKRYFPEINTGVPMLIAQAERMAVNMPIQGTEADIMKLAMKALDTWIKKEGVDAQQLLQVHDEIVFEVAKKDVDVVAKQVKKIMETIVAFDVPLVVDVKVGQSWGKTEEYK